MEFQALRTATLTACFYLLQSFFLKDKTGLELVPWTQFQHDF